MAKKGYYWIPPVDNTLNALDFFEARVKGDVKFDFKRDLIYVEMDRYFPTGSLFHFIGNCTEYYIKSRELKPGLCYVVKRTDGCPISLDDVSVFESGRPARRTGFAHEKKG